MMRSWRRRFLGPAPAADRVATAAEAQHDLREAQVDALRTEIARLTVLLSGAQLASWMWHGVARRQAAQLKLQQLDRTHELPRRALDAPTEYHPRRYR